MRKEEMTMNFDRNKVERVKEQYPVGTRIELQGLCNDEPGMPPGLPFVTDDDAPPAPEEISPEDDLPFEMTM
ncbi:DUF4314 domain-containing protein [bacterium D16-76]|nr:DUF4314 domain-containing protein [bacterium D16-76]